jgi:DNA-binding IclR family transcriptional regulator
VGAPVFNQQGEIEATLGLSGTIHQVNAQTMPRILEALKDAARHLSMQLGYRAPRRMAT